MYVGIGATVPVASASPDTELHLGCEDREKEDEQTSLKLGDYRGVWRERWGGGQREERDRERREGERERQREGGGGGLFDHCY